MPPASFLLLMIMVGIASATERTEESNLLFNNSPVDRSE
jgi:hypothetical protein